MPKKKSKGHWPKGRTRSDCDLSQWEPIQKQLARLLANPQRGGSADDPFRRSRRGLAMYLKVDSKNVTRWLVGDRRPMAKYLGKIERWISKIK